MNNQMYLDGLHPEKRNLFARFIAAVEAKGYTWISTSGTRSFAKQAVLHRNNPKNAKPGYSLHNYGLALDGNLQKGTKFWRKATSKEEWLATGIPQLAKSMGLRWGGDFKGYYDPVHFDCYYDTKKLLATAQKQFNTTDPNNIIGNEVNLS